MTGHSRGFAFVYFNDMQAAKYAKDAAQGMIIDGQQVITVLTLIPFTFLPEQRRRTINTELFS